MRDANLNVLWARALVEELTRGGVRHAIICPGSRSSPLALACAEVEGLRCTSVVDERSAAFVALGIAKATGSPAAVIATSGSAGAHFLPAAVEATQAGLPLILLTADRPPELQDFGAPQTIPQDGLMGVFAVHRVDLGLPEATDAVLLHLRANVSRAVALSQGPRRGAVQLNVPLREPLAPVDAPFDDSGLTPLALEGRAGAPFTHFCAAQLRASPETLAELTQRMAGTDRGVLVCGPRDADDGLGEALCALSSATGYPLIAETSSQVRVAEGGHPVVHADAILRHDDVADALRPDFVLRFGGGLTSKVLQSWLDASGADIAVFSEGGVPQDPAHAARWILEGEPVEAATRMSAAIQRGGGAYTEAFEKADMLAATVLSEALHQEAPLSEPWVARRVATLLPESAHLFVSSSMPIRALETFAGPALRVGRVHANRGANGIDGILSTALGVAIGSGRPTVCLTGDLAFLHDVGGLLSAARDQVPLTVVVLNNDGGGIFSFLPIARVGARAFEPFIATPHGVDLGHAAKLYGAHHHYVTAGEDFDDALERAIEGGLHVIEVRLSRAANVEFHNSLHERVRDALSKETWS